MFLMLGLYFTLKSDVSKLYIDSFGKEISRNIKFIVMLFSVVYAICVGVCIMCVYLYDDSDTGEVKYCLYRDTLFFIYFIFQDIMPIGLLLKFIYNIKPRYSDTFSDVIKDFMVNDTVDSK